MFGAGGVGGKRSTLSSSPSPPPHPPPPRTISRPQDSATKFGARALKTSRSLRRRFARLGPELNGDILWFRGLGGLRVSGFRGSGLGIRVLGNSGKFRPRT